LSTQDTGGIQTKPKKATTTNNNNKNNNNNNNDDNNNNNNNNNNTQTNNTTQHNTGNLKVQQHGPYRNTGAPSKCTRRVSSSSL